MRKFFKWLGITILVLILIVVIVSFVFISKYNKMAKVDYKVDPPLIDIPTDSASLARGMTLASSMCTGCHGGDFSGEQFFNDPALGTVPAPNITHGGRTKDYKDVDYIRTIRFGVKPDGHGIFVMPVEEFNYLSDADLGSLIAYLKTIPSSDKVWPDKDFTILAKVLAGAGAFGHLYNVEVLDLNNTAPRTAPEPSTDVKYGEYTMRIHGCWTCHGETLNGNKSPDPSSPPGENITTAGNFGKWSLDQFKNTLRTGTTPEGRSLDPQFMPWDALGTMSDMEIEAIFNYLRSIPAKEDEEHLAKYKEKNS